MKKALIYFPLWLCLFFGCMPASEIETRNHPAPPSFAPNPAELPIESSSETSTLKIHLLNVGQGDSTLLQMPNGKTLLIDAGNEGKGIEVVVPFLQSQNISKIDAALLSHYDADHMAGMDEVISFYPPDLGIFDRGQNPMDDSPFFSAYTSAAGTLRKSLQAGDEIRLDSSVKIRCVISNGQIWQGPLLSLEGPFSQKENASSLGILLEYGKFRYLTSGDLTGGGSPGGFQTLDLETELAHTLGKVSAVHVNHHGSSTSSNTTFVELTRPLIALFNVGNENEYGHPAQEVLERWKSVGSDLWLTEKGNGGFIAGENIANGHILLETDGVSMEVNGEGYEIE